MKPQKSLRVYLVTHHDGRITGTLLRAWAHLFGGPPLAAYGASQDEVLEHLQRMLLERDPEAVPLEHYLWDESFRLRTIDVEIHPQTLHKKRPIIGKGVIPLRVTCAESKMKQGGHRVLLPRFGWWFVVEDLSIARDVIESQLSAALLGEHPRWLYEFRREGNESILEWAPAAVLREPQSAPDDEEDLSSFPVLLSVADELTRKSARRHLPQLLGGDEGAPPPAAFVPAKGAKPASLLIVGGPGVGKTTWLFRLAALLGSLKSEQKWLPRLWRTSADRIIAGMVYLGMWQERCLRIVEELSNEGDWLFVDSLPALLRRQSDGGSMAEMFAPAMLAGQIALIAECSEEELSRARRQMPAFVDAFQVVRVEEIAPSRMPALLKVYQEARHYVRAVHPQALVDLVQLLDRFDRASLFPGKGFRFLDRLQQEAGPSPAAATLNPRDLVEAFSRHTGLPLELLDDARDAGRDQIAQALRRGVIGQDAACLACAGAVARLKAGLNDPERPVGVFLFAGPTGSGKTELAKQLARYLFGSGSRASVSGLELEDERLIRLDMSEYLTAGSAQRLLEVGPGVTSLAERVRRQPLSVVLLDEIEKAHPAVFDLLLGVLGEGRLTDSAGRLVDFRMTLIVMTSNLGSGEAEPAGFGAARSDHLRAVRDAFRPELLNRIDQIIGFQPLELESVERIVELELRKLGERLGLVRRGLRLRVEPAARARLARLGLDPKRGARPLKRVLEEKIVAPLAIRLARTPELQGVEIEVLAVDGPAWDKRSSDAIGV